MASHIPAPHPYLHEPRIYISDIPPYVTDANLAQAFVNCAPFRPVIARDGMSNYPVAGTIDFKFMDRAEKALATLNGRTIPELHPPVALVLSPFPPTWPPTPLPPPGASPRLIKHLPPGFTDSQLFDLFRPCGALASVRTQASFGADTGVVEFWHEEDARAAEVALHCAEVDGHSIAVQVYQPRRAPSGHATEFNAAAPTFVPSGSIYPMSGPSPGSPPRGSPYTRSTNLFVHGPGQMVQPAAPGTSHSGLIDPCNLFCKNLDPSIDSRTLDSHFRPFGNIVSARVMRNENGESRGFGFVSYQLPEQASAAMHAMNGALLGSKQIVVRLHEPKHLRQEKLAARFSGVGGHPRSASGATSPTLSDDRDSFGGWTSPRRTTSVLASPVGAHLSLDRPAHLRRGSGSYFQAAVSGTLNMPMQYDDLSSLTPTVRKEVLTGELSRRVKNLGLVPSGDVDSVVESLVGLSLSEVVQGIHDPEKLTEQVKSAHGTLQAKKDSVPPSPSASVDSRLLDGMTLNATASAPEHPSTPVSMSASLYTPPRTASPAGSLMPNGSERKRMADAVARLESSRQVELVDLLMSLPKRERAMCLFNVEVLRAKIADAKMVLDSEGDEEVQEPTEQQPSMVPAVAPSTPVAKRASVATVVGGSPQTPDLSSRGASVANSPLPATPSAPMFGYTLTSLAKLPALEVIRVANSTSATGFPLPKADAAVIKSTDEFVDGLMGKPVQQQKQALGDKIFRVIKGFGIKGAPKLTIALLDQEDLRGLAHLMNSYPAVLKEKAIMLASSK